MCPGSPLVAVGLVELMHRALPANLHMGGGGGGPKMWGPVWLHLRFWMGICKGYVYMYIHKAHMGYEACN